MRGDKKDKLRSENSEDAITWNVFRTLQHIDPAIWLPQLFRCSFKNEKFLQPQVVYISLWPAISPPPAIRLHQKDEGDSEVDILIETESIVWFIEAKYKSDISLHTTNNPKRDQIIRNIDVGSWYSGIRDFYFSLLILNENSSPSGMARLEEYKKSKDNILSSLPHRQDGLQNLRGLGYITWKNTAEILSNCVRTVPKEDERLFAERAIEWLEQRGIVACNET